MSEGEPSAGAGAAVPHAPQVVLALHAVHVLQLVWQQVV
jgi:hypothetical protein